MVKVHKRIAPSALEAVQESAEARIWPNIKGEQTPGFAVLFAACLELQELLQAAEERERDLRTDNGALRRQVDQLKSFVDGGNSTGLQEVGECVCGRRTAVRERRAQEASAPSARPPQVPPLHALLRANFLVDTPDGSQKGGLGETGVLQDVDSDVNLDEIPMGRDIWSIMDQSVRMRIEQWVVEQGHAVTQFGPLSELARSTDTVSHAPSGTDHGSIAFGTHGEEEGLLSLCDDESSSESEPDVDSIVDSIVPAISDMSKKIGSSVPQQGGVTSADKWVPDEWLMDTSEKEDVQSPKERMRIQRRAAQRRGQGRMRSSVETGPPVFMSQTLFGRIMCGMQERAPGVLQDALTPDLRDAFTPF
eukprot:CAMPEP_0179426396 /NCGR_PEP_ID=MMETSP0799-20121207/12711_1 /TAXON_ID=46947 /ORGANISM="Geminigera cryophila, Strain CCMP2564" /LENGTH=362 /DNA_ID=CAMNT_0021201135 /DNA_START=59 /DNA_END=1147 /DNA_ORIENTATION=+